MSLISVIVPVWNRERSILCLLKQLRGQVDVDFEVFVVDDCSTDGTSKVVDEFITRNYKFVHLRTDKNSGPAKARNIARNHITGEFIVFLDSDVSLLSNTFLRDMLNWYRCSENVFSTPLAGIEARQVFPERGNFWQKLFYLIPDMAGNTNQLLDCPKPINARWASTTASLWKKSVVEQLGWFESQIRTGEDSQLSYLARKDRMRFLLVPVDVLQDYRSSLKSFLKQQFWYGVGGGVMIRKHHDFIKRKHSVFYAYFVWSYKISKKYGLKYLMPLMLIQPLKHTFNLMGVIYGRILGKRCFKRN